MNRLRHWGIAFGLTIVAVVGCYFWLDRPLAYLAHDHLTQFKLFSRLTLITEPFTATAAIVLIILGIKSLSKRRLSHPEAIALLWSISIFVTAVLKNQFKFVFGRTWPETWTNNNPSLIRDGVHNFNPFHGGSGFESFPSGHMAAMCVTATILWLCYPRFKVAYALCTAVVAIGLIGANYHFLSDIIAGGFLGASVGFIAVVRHSAT